GAENVLPEETGGSGLLDGGQQAAVDVHHLAADVDERTVAVDGHRGDDHTLEQHVRVGHHQRHVLARARFGLVGVHHQVAGATVRWWQEAPLQPAGEPGTAATAQTGVLHHGHQVGGLHAQRSAQRPVAAGALVGLGLPRPGRVPQVAEHRRQGGHSDPSLPACSPCASGSPFASESPFAPDSPSASESPFASESSPAVGPDGEVSAGACGLRSALEPLSPTGSVPASCSAACSVRPAGARQLFFRASSRPTSVAGPAASPSSARPSSKPASTRETALKVATESEPRVGLTTSPASSFSTVSTAEVGVWLSKNSQLIIITGA